MNDNTRSNEMIKPARTEEEDVDVGREDLVDTLHTYTSHLHVAPSTALYCVI
jgi:hypothetical protein